MQQISKKRLGIAIGLAFFLIYFLGNLRALSGNSQINPYSPLIVLGIYFFMLSSFTFFVYALLGSLKNPIRLVLLLMSAFLIGPLVYYTLFPPFLYRQSYLLSDLYILIGDPLRDTYGVNWYWMDWGTWMTCIGFYLLAFYLYLANLIIGVILHRVKKTVHKQKR